MQERYLGDSHDFIKYGLLLHLHGALSVLKPPCRFVRRPIRFDQSELQVVVTPCSNPFLRCTTSGLLECCPDDRLSTLRPCRGD